MSKVLQMKPEGDITALVVPAHETLDEITVFWQNYKPGQGKVTITCFGEAWTTGFWSMGEKTIQDFFKECDVDYLITKMGITMHTKQNKHHHNYLGHIIEAVQKAMTCTTEN